MKNLAFYFAFVVCLACAFIIGMNVPEHDKNSQIYNAEVETEIFLSTVETTYIEVTTTITTEENFEDDTTLVEEETTTIETEENVNKPFQIWQIMKSYGWNDYMCAGILGNILAECAGDNMNYINEFAFNKTSDRFGLCQWSPERRKEIITINSTIEEQMEFLRWELMIDYWSTFEKLMACTDEQEAAEIFWSKYEKSKNIGRRRQNATDVYLAFTK